MAEDVLPERVEFLEQRVTYLEQVLEQLRTADRVSYITPRHGPKCWLCDEDHRGLPCPRSIPSCSVSVVDQ